jgi:CDP-glucose 4,6-dehydratase
MFSNIYYNRRILVTGHTGFKGSWLVLWLLSMGAEVTGIALPPDTDPAHWNLLSLDINSLMIDIRDEARFSQAVKDCNPEMIFHLAAQPLVRRSYREPLNTWSTNVLGTANLLEACRHLDNLQAILVVTTDKCYENQEWLWAYRENDRLGGHDPYSASKAASELVATSYRHSFYNTPESALLATARAGNVIGGGDWSEDRLIPDLVRAIQAGDQLEVRSPHSTRPWQHVLECLSGYLRLGQKMLQGEKKCAESWNFGPDRKGNQSVQKILCELQQNWNDVEWFTAQKPQPHEASLLHLDSSKAREFLSWRPVWTFAEGIAATARWYQCWQNDCDIISIKQLNDYTDTAKLRGLAWADQSK